MLYSILASLAIAIGAMGALCLLVMLMAGGANSTPEQIRLIKWLMLATVVGGLIVCVGGIVLICKSHPVWGGVVGVMPMAVLIGLMIWAEVS